jgi:aminoglycoside 3-N-acetyltransferase
MNKTEPPIIRKSQIESDLRALGIASGDVVMMHASVKRIGWVVGGPHVVLSAVFDVLTSDGTLMMYASWEDGPYTMEGWSEERKQAYREECPPFDPLTSRAYRKWSILTEYLRTWPGAFRSANPECSMVAVGAQAEWLTADHPLNYGFGKHSPLDKLCQIGGRVLLVGCPFSALTLLHYAEYLAKIPNKPVVHYQQPVLKDGQAEWVEVEEFDSNTPMGPWDRDDDPFEVLVKDFLAVQKGKSGKIGRADSFLFEARDLNTFAVEYLCVGAIIDARLAAGISGEIVSLVVSEQHRGSGIGRGLVEFAESWLTQRVVKIRVRANSLRSEAHEFYIRRGYQESKTQKIFEKYV